MAHVTYSRIRAKLAAYMDQVCNDRTTLLVTRRNERSVVLMSEETYDGLMETVHLLTARPTRRGCCVRSRMRMRAS
jgi:antitoxin YefM